MRVAVLCGGKGTRLGYDGQKCLIPIVGRPFLHWKLDQLVDQGATELHLLVAYRSQDVADAVGTKWGRVPVVYHQDEGEDRQRAHRDARVSFPHFLTYGDCLLDVPLVPRRFSYIWTNDEYPNDAGVAFFWKHTRFPVRRRTGARSHHINTPDDFAECEAYLRGAHATVHRLGSA